MYLPPSLSYPLTSFRLHLWYKNGWECLEYVEQLCGIRFFNILLQVGNVLFILGKTCSQFFHEMSTSLIQTYEELKMSIMVQYNMTKEYELCIIFSSCLFLVCKWILKFASLPIVVQYWSLFAIIVKFCFIYFFPRITIK